MTFRGLHQCLKAQLTAAFIQDIFKFIRSTIFGYNIYLTIAFGTFSYTLLLTYVKKHILEFTISMGAYINISNTSSTWAFSFSQQHIKRLGGVPHSSKHEEDRPEWFRHTIQLTKGKFCHQLRAVTQYKQGGLSNKSSSGEKGPPCHKSISQSGWKTKLKGNGWVKTMNDGANTSKRKQWWEWLPLFSQRRVKPMSIDQELLSLSRDINIWYKYNPSPYNWDR